MKHRAAVDDGAVASRQIERMLLATELLFAEATYQKAREQHAKFQDQDSYHLLQDAQECLVEIERRVDEAMVGEVVH